MTKAEYHAYCISTPNLPLFMQDWWMDAVCVDKEWEVIAGMPCLVRKRMGMRYILMPQQTQIGGCFMPGISSTEIAYELKEKHLAYYYQHFPIGSTLPKQLQKFGFKIREHVTYRIDDLSDVEGLQRQFSENKRRQIKKAAALQVVDLPSEEFYAFHQQCMEAQGKKIAYSEVFFKSLDSACESHQARKIIGLKDAQGALHAAVYLVYDKNVCYFLIPCYSPEHGDSGAGARIVLESIRFASTTSKIFDFEGSMIPGVANHYRQFGSQPVIFYEVEKAYRLIFRIVLPVYRLFTRKKR